MAFLGTLVSVAEVEVPIRTYYFIRIPTGRLNILQECLSSLLPAIVKDVGNSIFMVGFGETKDVFSDIQRLIDFYGIKIDTSLNISTKKMTPQKMN